MARATIKAQALIMLSFAHIRESIFDSILRVRRYLEVRNEQAHERFIVGGSKVPMILSLECLEIYNGFSYNASGFNSSTVRTDLIFSTHKH